MSGCLCRAQWENDTGHTFSPVHSLCVQMAIWSYQTWHHGGKLDRRETLSQLFLIELCWRNKNRHKRHNGWDIVIVKLCCEKFYWNILLYGQFETLLSSDTLELEITGVQSKWIMTEYNFSSTVILSKSLDLRSNVFPSFLPGITIGIIKIAFVNFLSYEMNTYFNKIEDITEQSDINKCFAVGKSSITSK